MNSMVYPVDGSMLRCSNLFCSEQVLYKSPHPYPMLLILMRYGCRLDCQVCGWGGGASPAGKKRFCMPKVPDSYDGWVGCMRRAFIRSQQVQSRPGFWGGLCCSVFRSAPLSPGCFGFIEKLSAPMSLHPKEVT